MSRLFALLLLAILLSPPLFAQAVVDDSYGLDTNVLYRDQSAPDFTDYMAERCRLDVYYPREVDSFATIVWFHGGGLRGGNRFLPEALKEQGLAVVPVNYRLHPKVTSPAYIEDAAAAVAWVFRNIEHYGGDPNLIFVSGHSAGGYLTSMIGLDTSWLQVHGVDANRIAGLVPYSGHAVTHFTIRRERGISWDKPIVDELAPIFHCRSDAPPLILITGDRDLELFGRYEEVAYQWRMMQAVGHAYCELYELDGYSHGAMAVPAHHILLNTVREIVKAKKTE